MSTALASANVAAARRWTTASHAWVSATTAATIAPSSTTGAARTPIQWSSPARSRTRISAPLTVAPPNTSARIRSACAASSGGMNSGSERPRISSGVQPNIRSTDGDTQVMWPSGATSNTMSDACSASLR